MANLSAHIAHLTGDLCSMCMHGIGCFLEAIQHSRKAEGISFMDRMNKVLVHPDQTYTTLRPGGPIVDRPFVRHNGQGISGVMSTHDDSIPDRHRANLEW
jgi:hypothetical protein